MRAFFYFMGIFALLNPRFWLGAFAGKGKLAWLAAVLGLLGYEGYALLFEEETLSHAMGSIFEAWPFFGVIVGLITGGLLVHFFWWWHPRKKKDR